MRRLKNARMANQKLATGGGVLQVDAEGFLEVEDEFVQAFLNSGFKIVAPLKKVEEQKAKEPEPPPVELNSGPGMECPEELKTVPREAKDADPIDLSGEEEKPAEPKFKRKESDAKWQRSKQ